MLCRQTATLIQLIDHVERDAYLIMSLLFKLNILPLMKQITKYLMRLAIRFALPDAAPTLASITGGIMSRTLSRGRSDRNEVL